jgi:hypothetical protein
MTIDVRADGRIFLANEAAFALPTAIGCDGNTLRVKNRGPAAVVITALVAGQTVDGGVSVTVPVRQTAVFVADGTNWDMLGGIETGGAPAPGTFPSGGIVLWHGLVSAVPLGWLLCDGTHGTPDLRNRFIVGASAEQNPGAIGGASTHVHVAHAALVHTGAAIADHAEQVHTGGGVSMHVGGAVADHASLAHTGAAVSSHAGATVSAHAGAAVSAHAGANVSAHTGCSVAAHTSVATKQGTATGNVVTTNTHTVTQAANHTVTQPNDHVVTQPSAHTVTQPNDHVVTQAMSHGALEHAVTQPSDHTVTPADAHAALTHVLTQASAHAGQEHNSVSNLPPYYEIAFIMKA